MKRSGWWGLLLILVGGLALLDGLDLIHLHAYRAWIWPTVLILLGLFSMLRSRRIEPVGLLLTAGGVYWLLIRLHVMAPVSFRIWGPCVLILIGIGCLFARRPAPYNTSSQSTASERQSYSDAGAQTHHASDATQGPTEYTSDGFVRSSVIFSGDERHFGGPVFGGADVSVLFGGCQLYLTDYQQAKQPCAIDVSCSFGGAKLYVPRQWRIERNGLTCLFGGCGFHGNADAQPVASISLRGFVAFGGVDIIYVECLDSAV